MGNIARIDEKVLIKFCFETPGNKPLGIFICKYWNIN
jgi:hypothetical protein